MSGKRVKLDPAYQSLELIDEENHHVLTAEKGSRQLKELVANANNNEDSLIQIEQHPLYQQEVDHNIQEVGIMAIREVRYVTEREWQKMIAMQKDQQQILSYLDQISRFQKRSTIASKIPRNTRGQFVSKQSCPKQKSIKHSGKRGRPRKEDKVSK